MLVILLILMGVAFYAVTIFNRLQTLLTEIEASIQEIGNQLKRQASLIPNLQESAKAYLKHERDIFDKLSSVRQAVGTAANTMNAGNLDKAESELQALLPKLQVVVEDNPELKANETIQQFMAELRDTADKLTYARRAVIDITQNYNQLMVTFPSNLIAGMFSFKKQPGLGTPTSGSHLEVSSAETKDVSVKL